MNAKQIEARFEELRTNGIFRSARWLSDSMAINRFTIRKILSGNVHTERDKKIFRAILEKIRISEQEFFGKDVSLAANEDPIPVDKVPLWGEIPAGNPTSITGAHEPEEMIEPPPGVRAKNLFALRVSGRSMYPRMIPGDIVYLEKLDYHLGFKDKSNPVPKLTFERLDGRIIAVLLNGDATLKLLRIKSLEGKDNYELKLVPFNAEFKTITVGPEDEVHFQGVVIRTVRDETLATFEKQETLS